MKLPRAIELRQDQKFFVAQFGVETGDETCSVHGIRDKSRPTSVSPPFKLVQLVLPSSYFLPFTCVERAKPTGVDLTR
jgi:hypothetical protein